MGSRTNTIPGSDFISLDNAHEETTEGFRVVFPNATYRVYPGTLKEHYTWASALHKVRFHTGQTGLATQDWTNVLAKHSGCKTTSLMQYHIFQQQHN